MAYDAERRQSRLGADRWQRLTGVGDAWGVEGAAVERNSSPHSHGSRSPEYFRVSEAGRLCELRKHGVERPPCAALRAGLRVRRYLVLYDHDFELLWSAAPVPGTGHRKAGSVKRHTLVQRSV